MEGIKEMKTIMGRQCSLRVEPEGGHWRLRKGGQGRNRKKNTWEREVLDKEKCRSAHFAPDLKEE